jgi:hypothetical protein
MNGPDELSQPLDQHVRLLTNALAILEEGDRASEYPRAVALRAAAELDLFLDAVNPREDCGYPPGFLAHIRRLRAQLDGNDPRAAGEDLHQAYKDLEKFLTYVQGRYRRRARGVGPSWIPRTRACDTLEAHATALRVSRYLDTLFRELSLDQVVEARLLLAEESVRVELCEAPPLLARHVYAATARARRHLDLPGSPRTLAARAEIERVLIFWNAVARP